MAEIVLGVGSSHGPTIGTKPEDWPKLGAEDQLDTRFDYAALRSRAGTEMLEQITPGRMRQRYDACQTGIKNLNQILVDSAPDVVLVLSNPHGGVMADRMQPTFGIYLDDEPPQTSRPGRRGPSTEGKPVEGHAYPTDADFARYLMGALVEEGFDLAASFQSRPGAGLDTAFRLLYEHYDLEAKMTFLPFLISRYLPNQATPKRCYELGQALRRTIEAWDEKRRVVIMASGGLSHQIIDEELDRRVIDALTEGDVDALCSLPRDRLNGAPGTPEILNWVAAAGAMEPGVMKLVDYVPCYRSDVGTGHGVTFGYWPVKN